jgi:hypothetical protein
LSVISMVSHQISVFRDNLQSSISVLYSICYNFLA